jgi:hypothetical protein
LLELARARTSLQAARVLADAGLGADSVSRAYYAIFHAASALVASIGRTARTHDGLRALVGEHFIRAGLLGSEHGRTLSRIAGDRNDADYNVAATFSIADVEEDIARATALVEDRRGVTGSPLIRGPRCAPITARSSRETSMPKKNETTRRHLVSMVAVAASVGCAVGVNESNARDAFKQLYACPVDRVTVADLPPPTPPADVASDPERLRIWHSQNDGHRLFRVEGCGHVDERMECWAGERSFHCD